MSRQLRPRKARPSYASMLEGDEDDIEEVTTNVDAGPSSSAKIVVDDDPDSGSDFMLEKEGAIGPTELNDDDDVEDVDVEDEMHVVSDPEEESRSSTKHIQSTTHDSRKKTTSKGKRKATAKHISSLGIPAKRQMTALPTPSINHRHRAVPLFSPTGRVERLTRKPRLFSLPDITMTNSFGQNVSITDRVNKSWGYNIGPGPIWEIVEDRGWYKEALRAGEDVGSDAKRRPVVYSDLRVKDGWELLSRQDAARYLPTDVFLTEGGSFKPPPPIPCLVGPIDSQTRLEIQIFESYSMSKYISGSESFIFNAGAPVWGLDWCPIHHEDRTARSYKQYIAVAPFPSSSHSPEIGVKVQKPSYACIQIWSLSPEDTAESQPRATKKKKDSRGQMTCEMILCLEGGPAHEIKWCPLPAHDTFTSSRKPKKLGILAGSFEDGSLSIYAVPDPVGVVPMQDSPMPIYVKLPKPLLRIELEGTSCWSIDWANSEVIAVGTTNGVIAVFNVGPALHNSNEPTSETITDIRPAHYITVHQSAIRSLAWLKVPPSSPTGEPCVTDDPTVIASGGYDGVVCMTDIRDGHGAVVNRTRDIINAMTFSPFTGGPMTMDHENTVKAYSASPTMLGRGHTLVEPSGPVWSLSSSDYHPQLAIGSADGSCMTTNTLKSTRRGGSVPFLVHKIYQMDYSRNTKEYRMLERFLPQEIHDRPSVTRAAKGKGKAQPTFLSTGAWPQEVGIHRVVWNSGNGMGSAGLLASATFSGLCRIDDLWGQWVRDKIPYGGVEQIRKESDASVMEVDSDDSLASD